MTLNNCQNNCLKSACDFKGTRFYLIFLCANNIIGLLALIPLRFLLQFKTAKEPESFFEQEEMAPEKGIIYSGEICNFIASLPGTLTIYTLLLIFEVRGGEIGPKMSL